MITCFVAHKSQQHKDFLVFFCTSVADINSYANQ